MDTADIGQKKIKSNISVKKVSILVLNYNEMDFLGDCLKALMKLNYPNYEVVFIDNASSDGSIAYVKKNFPHIKIIAHSINYGPCEGYNRAAQHVDGDYLAFLNSDIVVDTKWLTELIDAAEAYEADICGSKILLNGKPKIINYIGAKITIIGSAYCLHYGKQENQVKDITEPMITGSTGGAAMVTKRETFIKLQGFDPDYFWGNEETDLCWRAWLFGYKVIQVPSSVAYHKRGGLWIGRHSPTRIFYGQKNRLANVVKNFGFANLIKSMVISSVYDMVMIVKLLLNLESKAAAALIKGNIQFIRELQKSLKKRKQIQRNRRISDNQLYQLGIIASLRESILELIRLEKRPSTKG